MVKKKMTKMFIYRKIIIEVSFHLCIFFIMTRSVQTASSEVIFSHLALGIVGICVRTNNSLNCSLTAKEFSVFRYLPKRIKAFVFSTFKISVNKMVVISP